MNNILEFIPVGNAAEPVSRERLVQMTGMDDRSVREAINHAKKTYPIVNVGKGYYIADDPDDPDLRAYILQESHRIREISKGLRKHKALYKINKNQETLTV